MAALSMEEGRHSGIASQLNLSEFSPSRSQLVAPFRKQKLDISIKTNGEVGYLFTKSADSAAIHRFFSGNSPGSTI
jgi:hypothetical protein